jgi:catechol 2,3-dioxygenase-like lactoylglutathione lyase family enzyme
MLANAPLVASLPASDLDRARRWYEEKLGLVPTMDVGTEGFVYTSGGVRFMVYRTAFAGTGKHTVAGWIVGDLADAMRDLRARGVVFEEYAMGESGPNTEDGVARDPTGGATAWFTDSEGNILSLTQLPPGMTLD